jgi:hypothetical protein
VADVASQRPLDWENYISEASPAIFPTSNAGVLDENVTPLCQQERLEDDD